MDNKEYQFNGFSAPNFTQVPNQLFDELLPHLNETELKCLLYIVRRTFGFQRDSSEISLRQLTDGLVTSDGRVLDVGVGLKRSAVAKALQTLQAKGIIVSKRNADPQRGTLPSTYSLRFS